MAVAWPFQPQTSVVSRPLLDASKYWCAQKYVGRRGSVSACDRNQVVYRRVQPALLRRMGSLDRHLVVICHVRKGWPR